MSSSKLARTQVVEQPEEIEAPCATVKLGDWYWLAARERELYDQDLRESVVHTDALLVCVVHIGTNFVKVEDVGGHSWRVHFDKFDEQLTHEPDAASVWSQRGAAKQAAISGIMREINELTAALALQPSQAIAPSNETQAIASLGDVDVDGYKTELAQAKAQLPELFEQMEREHKQLARIMTANTLPLRAQAGDLKTLVQAIDARVLNIDLYAGLSEETEKIRDGEPAAYDEKLCVRQRMLFMDEECLPHYTAGGMTFKNVEAFDRWLCEHYTTLLPEPRCVVAFRVRREKRQYDGPNDISSFIDFWLESQTDLLTFLYIRNGEQVYRLSTKFDFGEQLFPNAAALSAGEELMMTRSSTPEIVTLREWEALADKRREGALAKREAGRTEHAKPGHSCGPWCWHHAETDEDIEAVIEQWRERWVPFTPDSVYYDDANAIIEKDIKHFNRVALILQGLFDRSMCLHPHPPVKTWNVEGFDRAIKLVYDDGLAIAPADKPDWPSYWERCNAALRVGSMTIGQRKQWNDSTRESYERYTGRPARLPGDKGPDRVHAVDKISRTGQVTYRYTRETNTLDQRSREWKVVACRFVCEREDVFNADAYKPGDFHKFYDDPRTRREYMKWARFLLAAEDYKARKTGDES
jgi:hypothetical protein